MKSRARLLVLNPTEEPVETSSRAAARLGALRGKVIGYLWNSKPHGDLVLKLLATRLEEAHGAAEAVLVQKEIIGSRAPQKILEKLALNCDAVVTALGD